MEENSEVQMETDVSSMPENVDEAQSVIETHRNIKTVIFVENIKEEDLFGSTKNESISFPKPSIEIKRSDDDLSKDLQQNIQSKLPLSPSKDVSNNDGEEQPLHKHDQEHKTYNNKHKLQLRSEQLQLSSNTDDSQKSLHKSVTPDTQKPNSNDKFLLKSTQVQSPGQKSNSPSKPDGSKKTCNDDENNPLKTEKPQEDVNDTEKSSLKTVQSDNINIDKPVLKIGQSSKTYISRCHSQLKSDWKQNIPNTIPTNCLENAILNDSASTALNTSKGADETLPPKIETETQSHYSPEKQLPTEQTKEPLNKLEDDAIISSSIKSKENCMLVADTLIESGENYNDSHTGSISDDKDVNKGISRELKSLIKSAKESKIISECNQVTSKTRKSRSALDTSLNSSVESGKIQEVRRSSINSQISSSSEKSEKAPKRSMRSQNPEFVNKVKQFLNSVTGKFNKAESDEEIDAVKETQHESVFSPSKKKKQAEVIDVDPTTCSNKLRTDPYCWRCHWGLELVNSEKVHPPMQCTVCPRALHYRCLTSNEKNKISSDKSWVCPECLGVLHAESSETRSPAMKKVSVGMLRELLHYALERLKNQNGVEPFLQPVDRTIVTDYDTYIVNPMDLSLMKNNITEGIYGSTEAFLADAQWILHNSVIFNTVQSKLTGGARALVRSCKAEMGEIEACPECYAAAHARKPTWFTDVCSTPHVLLWAKLKGFPFWPAKGMTVSCTGMVDVRFFGAHDRAWVPAKDCYLYCEKDPNNFRSKRQDILDSIQEAQEHIRNISKKYKQYVYPPFKTPLDPTKLSEQLKMMIPSFDGEVHVPLIKPANASPSILKGKSRSNSKSSKSSCNDGDVSECDDIQESRKMADGAEIARDEEFTMDKNQTFEVKDNEKEPSRKRRRSELEEAVITIMESSEKKRKIDNDEVFTTKDIPKEIDNIDENVSAPDNKPQEKDIAPVEKVVTRSNEPEATTVPPVKTPPKIKPIRISLLRDNNRAIAIPKIVKAERVIDKDKSDKNKSQKRRNSKNRQSNQNGKTEKKNDKIVKIIIKDKSKDVSKFKIIEDKNGNLNKTSTDKTKAGTDKAKASTDKAKACTDKTKKDGQNDDDTALAVIAREVTQAKVSGLPTISSVRSLSTTATNTDTATKTTTSAKSSDVTTTVSSSSSIFTLTSTDNVRNVKETANKLQKLKNDDPPLVGRVGVRAFARMTSPEPQPSKPNEIEIKSEPMDFDDAERQVEKVDMMKQFHLRPVNQANPANPANQTNQSVNLREVRINKVVVAPIARKSVTKPPETRVKAKKTFPQPRKVDDGRSELNSKNSMVYIPIQPPSTQAPIRPSRPITINVTANTNTVRPQVSITTSTVNTLTTPLVPMLNSIQPPCTTVATSSTVCLTTVTQAPTGPSGNPTNIIQVSSITQPSNIGQVGAVCPVSAAQLPTVGQLNAISQVPTNVHTVPLITSVNGQWTFSLQPIMSVGGLDESSPLMNGVPDRNPPITPLPSLPGVQPIQIVGADRQGPLNTICNTNSDNPGEPPRLQQKPLLNPLDPNTPIGAMPPPSTAGPVTAKLNQNAVKLTDFFRTLLEDTLDKVDEPAAQATLLKMQLEHMQWRHLQEVRELKHNHELTIMEMRASYEKDKARVASDARRTAQVELEAAVKATKAKQWCANCSQEAQFYCCWNTSYCDYPCQKAHWNTHYAHCTQQRNAGSNGDSGNAIEKRLQPAPDNLPKNAQAPTLTVGNRLTSTRVYTQDNPPPKTSIIVSMMEDQSGNQTMKCVGTYKPGSSQVAPVIVNKQIMNTDEGSKKVVTSGGYLIVGGTAPLVTPPRRTHTIQYYT